MATSEAKCPVCGQEAEILNPGNNNYRNATKYHCELCGYFMITDDNGLLTEIENNIGKNHELIFALRKHSSKDNIVQISSSEDFDRLISETQFPQTWKEKEKLLAFYVYDRMGKKNGDVFIDKATCAVMGVSDQLEFRKYRQNIINSPLFNKQKTLLANATIGLTLSTYGINYIESILYPEEPQEEKTMSITQKKQWKKACFLVHGRDDAFKNKVARYIEKNYNLDVIILHERPNAGRTILEKFEAHSSDDVIDFALCLYTPDDIGCLAGDASDPASMSKRARQNVIFEAGYFFGKLGRKRTIILKAPTVENPSDIHGLGYIGTEGQWTTDLDKEISAIYGDDIKDIRK